jgi:hypothetical protein
MHDELERAYESLAAWCREHEYTGYDPFDGLNSRVFQSTPLLKDSRLARLVWTQVFKRSPINFRRIARVPVGRNAKGTALFALAALARFRGTRSAEDEREVRSLLDDLLVARLENWSGAAWGYNFDWQGRAFFAPRGTPAIVPTAFAARALVEATRTLGDEAYLHTARSVCDFILRDLARIVETGDEICFSYTPHDRTRVFNASLLAGEVLASVGALTGEQHLIEWAQRAARYVVRHQREDGSWAYGDDSYQAWADNFHTAFVLFSLARIIGYGETIGDDFTGALRRGYEFWRDRFFLTDGWPKYYPDNVYPADAHAAGASVVTMLEMQKLDTSALERAARTALWATRTLQDGRGFFYYQRRRFYTVHTPYMRWSQAWMMYALASLLEGKRQKEKGKSI